MSDFRFFSTVAFVTAMLISSVVLAANHIYYVSASAEIGQLRADIDRLDGLVSEDIAGQATAWNQKISARQRWNGVPIAGLLVPNGWDRIQMLEFSQIHQEKGASVMPTLRSDLECALCYHEPTHGRLCGTCYADWCASRSISAAQMSADPEYHCLAVNDYHQQDSYILEFTARCERGRVALTEARRQVTASICREVGCDPPHA